MYLTIKDVSQMLQIKPSTLYAWVAQGKIPFVKIHGCIRFWPEELERWIETFRPDAHLEVAAAPWTPAARGDLDEILARAKRAVYTSCRGKPDQDRAKQGGD